MICTDVAARGLDFPNVEFTIMFDPSPSYKQHINRAGRTGRAEKMGACINLLYPEEERYVEILKADTPIEKIECGVIDKNILLYQKLLRS